MHAIQLKAAMTLAVLGLTLLNNRNACAAKPDEPEKSESTRGRATQRERTEKPETPPREPGRTFMAHVVDLRLDIGKATDMGLGYMHRHETWVVRSQGPGGGILTLEYGLNAHAVALHREIATVFPMASVRVGALGFCANVFALEGSFGRAPDRTSVAEAAIFANFYYVEIGYAYRAPIDASRPDWMSTHQFAVRIPITVSKHGLTLTQTEEPVIRAHE